MQEAELFLERLGADWTVEHLQSRIDYLYRLVNDAFERAYILCVKENVNTGVSPASKDHLAEIRNLQRMIRQRIAETAPVIEVALIPSPAASAMEIPQTVEEPRRSLSADDCQLSPQPIHHQFHQEQQQKEQARFIAPSYPPVDISQGLVYNGVENKVNFYCLTLDNKYHLTSSQADMVEPARASGSGSGDALSSLMMQLEALEVTNKPEEPSDDQVPMVTERIPREIIANVTTFRQSTSDLGKKEATSPTGLVLRSQSVPELKAKKVKELVTIYEGFMNH